MKGRRTPPATTAPETGPMRKDMVVNVDPESTARLADQLCAEQLALILTAFRITGNGHRGIPQL